LTVCCAAVAVVVSACGGSDSSSESPTAEASSSAAATTGSAAPTDSSAASTESPAASGPTITIESFAFGDPLTVEPGATIQIVNNDSAEHSVTSDTEGLFDVHVDGGQTGTMTAPTEPGEYTYYCVYHPDMKGTLIVQ
jgi:plastocyanin